MSSGSEETSTNKSPKSNKNSGQTRARGGKNSPQSSSNNKKSSPSRGSSNNNNNNGSKMPSHLTLEEEKHEVSKMVLWQRPLQTVFYFLLELVEMVVKYFVQVLAYRKLVLLGLLVAGLIAVGFHTDGSHLATLLYLRKKFFWYAYWVGLGVASSIGLGTGLHTFILYLGPFITEVTLAAYECKSLDFPEPPYPDEIMCPSSSPSSESAAAATAVISIWSIMSKVRWESIMWGAGTAIGELPPYFMARASALSNMENHQSASSDVDEELQEFDNLLKIEQDGSRALTWSEKMRLLVFKAIKKVGFLGILLCASIPNPLFDLAGITCGHFLVKFWTFFGATLIGKAIIKMHIQQITVIFLFSEHHLKSVFDLMGRLPVVGASLQPVLQEWLVAEKNKLHKKALNNELHAPSESLISRLFGWIVLLMILFFVVSIVNSLAQQRYKRMLNSRASEKKVASD